MGLDSAEMNKRLRKKKHKGEFNWRGFDVECKFDRELSAEEVDRLVDTFIEFVESRNLGCGGGFGPRDMGQYITKSVPHIRRSPNGRQKFSNAHCTSEDVVAIMQWLSNLDFIEEVKVGALEGGW